MMNEGRVISIVVDADTEERLKVAATLRDVSVGQICFEIIEEESRKPWIERGLLFAEDKGEAKKRGLMEVIAKCRELTGGMPLGGPDSAELIRESREERMRDIERAIADDGSC